MKVYGYRMASKEKRLFASLTEGIIFFILLMIIYFILGLSFSTYLNRDFKAKEITESAIGGLIVGAIFYPLFTGN